MAKVPSGKKRTPMQQPSTPSVEGEDLVTAAFPADVLDSESIVTTTTTPAAVVVEPEQQSAEQPPEQSQPQEEPAAAAPPQEDAGDSEPDDVVAHLSLIQSYGMVTVEQFCRYGNVGIDNAPYGRLLLQRYQDNGLITRVWRDGSARYSLSVAGEQHLEAKQNDRRSQ